MFLNYLRLQLTLCYNTPTWYQGQNPLSGEIISPFSIINQCIVKFC